MAPGSCTSSCWGRRAGGTWGQTGCSPLIQRTRLPVAGIHRFAASSATLAALPRGARSRRGLECWTDPGLTPWALLFRPFGAQFVAPPPAVVFYLARLVCSHRVRALPVCGLANNSDPKSVSLIAATTACRRNGKKRGKAPCVPSLVPVSSAGDVAGPLRMRGPLPIPGQARAHRRGRLRPRKVS